MAECVVLLRSKGVFPSVFTKPNEGVKSKFVIPSEPGFPATLHWTQPRVLFSVGENRMKSVNANKINRKSGEAEGSVVRPGCFPKLPVLTHALTSWATLSQSCPN